jgi:hypothetical protein
VKSQFLAFSLTVFLIVPAASGAPQAQFQMRTPSEIDYGARQEADYAHTKQLLLDKAFSDNIAKQDVVDPKTGKVITYAGDLNLSGFYRDAAAAGLGPNEMQAARQYDQQQKSAHANQATTGTQVPPTVDSPAKVPDNRTALQTIEDQANAKSSMGATDTRSHAQLVEDSYNPANKAVNFSGIPCQYVGVGRVFQSSKDTGGRYCVLDNYSNNFSLVTFWMYSEKHPLDGYNPLIQNYSVTYVCPTSTVIVQTAFLGIRSNRAIMVDTLVEGDFFKKLYQMHCGY